MKKLLYILLIINQFSFSQIETDWKHEKWEESNFLYKTTQIMSCPSSNTLSTGYPAWTNYYAGYMIKINNVSSNTVQINCFEARFQGTSGYRIYTKTGTFIGFENTPAAWTLVGTANNVVGISTTTSSPIPILMNIPINPGNSQSFYLTRTDNLVANRHLYISGTGTPGTTIYASDANLQITEANYLDCFFILQVGARRPSLQVYYNLILPLPIESQPQIISTEPNNISSPLIKNITDLLGTDYGKNIPLDFKGVLIIKYEDGSFQKILKY